MKKGRKIFFVLIFLLMISEGMLRLLGLRPGAPMKEYREVRPISYLISDSLLGWRLNPGTYITFIKGKEVASHTVNNDGNRVTSEINDSVAVNKHTKQKIFLFGCSYTFGYTLSDSNTYPYYLQTMLPEYEIVNKAVPGYALVQMYLSLKKEVEVGNKPAIAVFNYASFHDARNSLAKNWVWIFQSQVSKSKIDKLKKVKYPYGKLTETDSLSILFCQGKDWYEEHPIRDKSALLTGIHLLYNVSYDLLHKKDYNTISFLIGCKILEYCKENDIRILFTGMDKSSEEVLNKLKRINAETLLFKVNVSDKDYNNGILDPYHPSDKAHKKYAKEVLSVIIKQR